MNIAILGFDLQGRSAYEYWNTPDNTLTICDQNADITVPDGVKTQLGDDYLKNLGEYDILVRTSGLPPHKIAEANPETPDILKSVTSVTNEFFKVCPTKNIIGVTGTKGKGTTSTLIARMLEAAGKRVHLGGNIGISPLELLKNDIKDDDWVVLELASFQLIDLKYSPSIAVCLMVVTEHLDWHKDMAEYVSAKQQLFVWQTPDDIAIYFAPNEYSRTIAEAGLGVKLPYYAPPGVVVEDGMIRIDDLDICSVEDIKLLGKHNWQNVCAATTVVWQITHSKETIRSVLSSFAGLPHRLEFVREVDGVKYYDDSFGTTPETAIVAVQAFSEPKVLILGGSDKGADYTELARVVASSNVRHVLIIGATGAAIEETLHSAGYTDTSRPEPNMQSIVAAAKDAAESGDVVLLSPACASFDMFKDYKDRGEQFRQLVASLD